MTPSLSGRIAWIVPGVRPSIRLASTPTAWTSPVRWSIATTDGSERTMRRPRTYTTVLAVPRSPPLARPPKALPEAKTPMTVRRFKLALAETVRAWEPSREEIDEQGAGQADD